MNFYKALCQWHGGNRKYFLTIKMEFSNRVKKSGVFYRRRNKILKKWRVDKRVKNQGEGK